MFFLIICILFTTLYNQNIHNEGQRHIIVHTDPCEQTLSHSYNRFCSTSDTSKSCLIFACYLSVSATFHGFKKKKNIISGQGACFTI